MNSKYGEFSDVQWDGYKKKLHKDLFWLLLYKDPSIDEECTPEELDELFDLLMRKINGLNEVLLHPNGLIELLCSLEAARKEANKKEFNYKIYRKFVLDAHNLLDRLEVRNDYDE